MASASHASSRGSDVRDRSSPSSPAENEEMGDQVKREFAAQAKSMSKSRKSKNKNFDNRDRAEEDLRLLSKRAGATFKNSKLDMFLARWGLIPAWIVLMCTLASSISFIPVIVVEWSPNFDTLGKWVWRGFVIAGFLNSLPFWIALSQWRPAEPLNGKPMGALPHVDILIPTYKEPTASIIETIVSCQRVEYSSNKMHCYILDDGQSNDLRQAVAALKKSGLLRFSLTYVRRPTNEGKKGGNLNYWLRTYEEVSGEFFLVLDADMQPFPDMLDTLMGHYYGLSEETRDRLSFIQAPQWYKNSYAEARWKDLFNVSEVCRLQPRAFLYRIRIKSESPSSSTSFLTLSHPSISLCLSPHLMGKLAPLLFLPQDSFLQGLATSYVVPWLCSLCWLPGAVE